VWARIRQSPDWRFVAMLISLMAMLQAIGPEYFRYERDWNSTGEIWRIVTAHWVHVSWLHLLLNGFGLVICVSLTNPGWSIRRWLTISIIVALGVSLMLTFFNPEVSDYAGYSGVLYGLYVLAAISLFSGDRLVAGLVIAAIVIKVFMEQFNLYDFNTGKLIGAHVVVDAHLYGLLMAIAIALIWATYTMNHGPNRHSDLHE
jgi:rhomboid family GlyGly-CTERM serine protease